MSREKVHRLMALPAAAAHASWLGFIPHELISAARRSPLATLVLSRLLSAHADLGEPEIPTALPRWTLKESPDLLSFARRAGAIALGPAIAPCIDRHRVRMLKSVLGEELYREAVTSGALRLTHTPDLDAGAFSGEDALRDFFEHIGATLLLGTLSQGSLMRRVALKFPRAHVQTPAFELSEDDQRVVSAWLDAISEGA